MDVFTLVIYTLATCNYAALFTSVFLAKQNDYTPFYYNLTFQKYSTPYTGNGTCGANITAIPGVDTTSAVLFKVNVYVALGICTGILLVRSVGITFVNWTRWCRKRGVYTLTIDGLFFKYYLETTNTREIRVSSPPYLSITLSWFLLFTASVTLIGLLCILNEVEMLATIIYMCVIHIFIWVFIIESMSLERNDPTKVIQAASPMCFFRATILTFFILLLVILNMVETLWFITSKQWRIQLSVVSLTLVFLLQYAFLGYVCTSSRAENTSSWFPNIGRLVRGTQGIPIYLWVIHEFLLALAILLTSIFLFIQDTIA